MSADPYDGKKSKILAFGFPPKRRPHPIWFNDPPFWRRRPWTIFIFVVLSAAAVVISSTLPLILRKLH